VWAAPERYSSWISHYEALRLNPQALNGK